jgi:hypothetical protein
MLAHDSWLGQADAFARVPDCSRGGAAPMQHTEMQMLLVVRLSSEQCTTLYTTAGQMRRWTKLCMLRLAPRVSL